MSISMNVYSEMKCRPQCVTDQQTLKTFVEELQPKVSDLLSLIENEEEGKGADKMKAVVELLEIMDSLKRIKYFGEFTTYEHMFEHVWSFHTIECLMRLYSGQERNEEKARCAQLVSLVAIRYRIIFIKSAADLLEETSVFLSNVECFLQHISIRLFYFYLEIPQVQPCKVWQKCRMALISYLDAHPDRVLAFDYLQVIEIITHFYRRRCPFSFSDKLSIYSSICLLIDKSATDRNDSINIIYPFIAILVTSKISFFERYDLMDSLVMKMVEEPAIFLRFYEKSMTFRRVFVPHFVNNDPEKKIELVLTLMKSESSSTLLQSLILIKVLAQCVQKHILLKAAALRGVIQVLIHRLKVGTFDEKISVCECFYEMIRKLGKRLYVLPEFEISTIVGCILGMLSEDGSLTVSRIKHIGLLLKKIIRFEDFQRQFDDLETNFWKELSRVGREVLSRQQFGQIRSLVFVQILTMMDVIEKESQ